MPWPAGSTVGGKPYREMRTAELGIAGANIGSLATLQLQLVPWWSGGFKRASINFLFNGAAGGGVQMFVTPWSMEPLEAGIQAELMNGSTAGEIFPPGGGNIEIAFDDSVWPGNYRTTTIVPTAGNSMPLNPTWKNAPFLEFVISNRQAAAISIVNFRICLGG